MAITHDIEAAWNQKKVISMLTFDITGFFDSIPHSHLLNTLRTHHIPLPIVKWTHNFLQDRRAIIHLDGQRDQLKDVQTGVPQGSCASPILAAYFTSTMSKAIQEGVADKARDNPALRQKLMQGSATLLPPTLYVNDGSLSASAENRVDTTELVKLAFTEAHTWLRERGLKTDQVKK